MLADLMQNSEVLMFLLFLLGHRQWHFIGRSRGMALMWQTPQPVL